MTKNFKLNSLALRFIFTIILFQLIACGKRPEQNILEHIYVETSVKEDNVWVSLVTELNLGGLEMTAISLPIHDPKSPGEYYGELNFTTDLSSFNNVVEVNLNLSKVAKIRGSAFPTLPTGEDIPFRGVGDGDIVELEVPNIKAKVYVLLRQDTVIVGYASVIDKFAKASGYLGGADVFFGFNHYPVRGSLGFFSDKEAAEAGLGVFADLSNVMSPDIIKEYVEIRSKRNHVSLDVQELSKANRKAVIRSYLKLSKQ
jgi:hypothetical protein